MQGKGGVLATKAAAVQGNGGALTGGGGGEGQDTLGGQPVNGRPHRLYTGGRHGEGRCKDEGKDGGKTSERTAKGTERALQMHAVDCSKRQYFSEKRARLRRCTRSRSLCVSVITAVWSWSGCTTRRKGGRFGGAQGEARSVRLVAARCAASGVRWSTAGWFGREEGG